jgi:hypothetical protein
MKHFYTLLLYLRKSAPVLDKKRETPQSLFRNMKKFQRERRKVPRRTDEKGQILHLLA